MLTLCQKHSNVEWSGYCLHEKTGDLFNETIIVHGVYLMDIGSATATDFKGNPDVATLIDEYPEIGDLIFGRGYRILQCKVHSHNNMSSFFSQGAGVSDQQDLEDNSKGQDVYVSIVVNNKMEFFAKACRWVKTEKTQKTVQVLNKSKYQPYTYEVPAGEEKMVQNCNVKIDMQRPDWFNKRLTEVKPAPVLKPAYNYTIPGGINTGWGGTYLPKSVAQQREFDFYSEPVEEEYTFDDELKFVFGLPKKCEPEVYLRTEKIDMEVMKENLSTYGKKAEDEFFDQLAVWVISADLQESPFYNQITKFLTSVEF